MKTFFYMILLIIGVVIAMTLGIWTALVYILGVLSGMKVDDTAAYLHRQVSPLARRYNRE